MAGRISPGAPRQGSSYRRHLEGDGTPEFATAATDNHHLLLGPGDAAIAEYRAAGIEVPDLGAIRTYRQERVRGALKAFDYDGVIVMDPMNIRYITDTTNMQIWLSLIHI